MVFAGPVAFGVGESLSIINSSIATALEADVAINPSQVSFNNGTFRVATASPDVHDVYRWAVPGHEYFFAYYDGSIHMTDDNGHVTRFKVLDVRQDATYTYVDTTLGAILPTPTFLGGLPANQFVAYPVTTVTETNSGPADFASLIPPVDTPPVVTVSNLIATHGQSFAASLLFTASDPDGDFITQYGFWDTGAGGGHYVLAAVRLRPRSLVRHAMLLEVLVAQELTPEAALKLIGINVAKAQRTAKAQQINKLPRFFEAAIERFLEAAPEKDAARLTKPAARRPSPRHMPSKNSIMEKPRSGIIIGMVLAALSGTMIGMICGWLVWAHP